jgi:UDP-glucose 4-epimerase
MTRSSATVHVTGGDGEIGEDHDPETHLIPLVLDAACGRRPHLTVHGSDYDTPTAPASATTSMSTIWRMRV